VTFRRLLAALMTLALLAPATASAEDFDPSTEFKLKDWVPIHLGGLDLSINRAVVYLLVGGALTCLLGVGLMRWRLGVKPGRRQTVGELIYDIAQTQVAETGLPSVRLALTAEETLIFAHVPPVMFVNLPTA